MSCDITYDNLLELSKAHSVSGGTSLVTCYIPPNTST